jgi:(p)ppGpp synthase/HD superfamily hydrolase
MKLSDRLRHAINTAAVAHNGQLRKYGDVPYVTHPFGIAVILSNYTDNEDVVIAGLLHDVIEDTDPAIYSANDIERDFGPRVLELVRGVTEDTSIKDYRSRRQAYLDHLATTDQDTMLISAADFTHNMRTLKDDISDMGLEKWRSLVDDSDARVWAYRKRYETLKKHLESALIAEVEQAYHDVAAIIGS